MGNIDLSLLYEKAIKLPDFRQEFVDMINIEAIKKYISNIVVRDKAKKKYIMNLREFPAFWTQRKPEIRIYPCAFEDIDIHQNFHDFNSTLIHFAGYNAFKKHSNQKSESWIKSQIDTYENVLNNLNHKNSLVYRNFITNLKNYYEKYENPSKDLRKDF